MKPTRGVVTKQVLLSIFLSLLIIWGIGTNCLAVETLVIEGTGDSQDLLRILAKAYEKNHRDAHIEIPDSIGTTGGVKITSEGKCVMGRTARKLRDKEKAYNLNYKEFAYSPVVFIANLYDKKPDNLSTEQIIDIFSGKITSWEELGGQRQPIYVVNRQEDDSARNVLEQNMAGFKDIKKLAGKTVYTTPKTIDILNRYKNTIGYGPYSMTVNSGLTVLKVDGLYPSIKDVQSGTYKFMAPFGLVWKGELTGLAKDFVDFLFTKEAQTIMIKNGTVPVKMQ
ncbi:substrate-binding domain-containing protein [Candidatus Magnetobacterium casense]|uniref:Substrate-binding domain-containing protein n=1 Tax=Candidatus Magnetobacterium casense TaxID=1455061 RepID=A0ABS6RX35_9BACT|nr:substrate-binding domain-containing protein [Candidatus Magnetobacterium casensis]MBV6341181.1 substrate-binding domain-containing protein [Candidatus Magnetobacterium casensis]